MLEALLEKFEDIFQPITDEERDKRYVNDRKCFSCGERPEEGVRYEGKSKNLTVYLCKRCLEAGMKDKLVKEDKDFRDIFQPISDEEASKRLWPRLVAGFQAHAGAEGDKGGVSEEQIRSILMAMAIDPELKEDADEWVKDYYDELVRVHHEEFDEEDDAPDDPEAERVG